MFDVNDEIGVPTPWSGGYTELSHLEPFVLEFRWDGGQINRKYFNQSRMRVIVLCPLPPSRGGITEWAKILKIHYKNIPSLKLKFINTKNEKKKLHTYC